MHVCCVDKLFTLFPGSISRNRFSHLMFCHITSGLSHHQWSRTAFELWQAKCVTLELTKMWNVSNCVRVVICPEELGLSAGQSMRDLSLALWFRTLSLSASDALFQSRTFERSEAEHSSVPKQNVRAFQSRTFESSKAERSRKSCARFQSRAFDGFWLGDKQNIRENGSALDCSALESRVLNTSACCMQAWRNCILCSGMRSTCGDARGNS